MKLKSRYLFGLLSGLILCSLTANAAVDMRHCVDFIRGDQALAPYLPVNKNGELDRAALNKLVADKKATYELADGVEVIKSNEGARDIQIRINRKSGLIEQIDFSATSTAPFSLPYPGEIYKANQATKMSEARTFKFRYQDNNCIPESERFTHSSLVEGRPMSASSGLSFDIDTCRKLKTFFDRNPGTKSCGESKVSNELQGIVDQLSENFFSSPYFGTSGYFGNPYLPNPYTPNPYLPNKPSDPSVGGKAAANSGVGTGDVWFKGKGAFQKCLQSPGVNSAMMQEKFWKKNEKTGESSSSTTK